MNAKARRKRHQRIVLAYARVLGRRWPENPNDLLPAVFAAVPDTSMQEIADAIQWGIRQSKRSGARFERAMRAARRADRQADDYDPGDDFSRSIDEAYAAIRARVAAGGRGWEPPR